MAPPTRAPNSIRIGSEKDFRGSAGVGQLEAVGDVPRGESHRFLRLWFPLRQSLRGKPREMGPLGGLRSQHWRGTQVPSGFLARNQKEVLTPPVLDGLARGGYPPSSLKYTLLSSS